MPVDWKQHVVSTPDVLRGKPRLKKTRIPVSLILGHLAAGQTVGEIVREYPDLAREQIAACLDYARALAKLKNRTDGPRGSSLTMADAWVMELEDAAK